jgi:hypothetical protein
MLTYSEKCLVPCASKLRRTPATAKPYAELSVAFLPVVLPRGISTQKPLDFQPLRRCPGFPGPAEPFH